MSETGPFQGFILNYSTDALLLSTREAMLSKAGYIVTSVSAPEEFEILLRQVGSFDLAILCHSIPEIERTELERHVRERFPDIPIFSVPAGTSGGDFMAKVRSMCRPVQNF